MSRTRGREPRAARQRPGGVTPVPNDFGSDERGSQRTCERAPGARFRNAPRLYRKVPDCERTRLRRTTGAGDRSCGWCPLLPSREAFRARCTTRPPRSRMQVLTTPAPSFAFESPRRTEGACVSDLLGANASDIVDKGGDCLPNVVDAFDDDGRRHVWVPWAPFARYRCSPAEARERSRTVHEGGSTNGAWRASKQYRYQTWRGQGDASRKFGLSVQRRCVLRVDWWQGLPVCGRSATGAGGGGVVGPVVGGLVGPLAAMISHSDGSIPRPALRRTTRCATIPSVAVPER
jgi:hypothetical protein